MLTSIQVVFCIATIFRTTVEFISPVSTFNDAVTSGTGWQTLSVLITAELVPTTARCENNYSILDIQDKICKFSETK